MDACLLSTLDKFDAFDFDPPTTLSIPPAGKIMVDDNLELYLSRIVDQDQAALTALFKLLANKVHSLCLRITGNHTLAEEATEDTFFQVWRQAPRYDPNRGSAQAWIMTIARSRALDALRKVPPFDSSDAEGYEELTERHSLDSLTDLLSASQECQLLHQALAQLEEVPRQLLALAYFKGFSQDEIARQTALPLGTVKSHIRRALIQLRNLLTLDC